MPSRLLPESPSAPTNSAPGFIEEYERRRCAVCGAKYPPFGFGPPLTRPGIMLWACGDQREELGRQLRPENPPPLETPKMTLF
jgi:hypothetical protein